MAITKKNGKLVASFPIEEADQIMLVTDKGSSFMGNDRWEISFGV